MNMKVEKLTDIIFKTYIKNISYTLDFLKAVFIIGIWQEGLIGWFYVYGRR